MIDNAHKGFGCLKCPVRACDAQYRGSRCSDLRAKVGADFDPMTNTDYIQSVQTVQQMAKLFIRIAANGCPPDMDWDCTKDEYGQDACYACWERWLQQPAREETN